MTPHRLEDLDIRFFGSLWFSLGFRFQVPERKKCFILLFISVIKIRTLIFFFWTNTNFNKSLFIIKNFLYFLAKKKKQTFYTVWISLYYWFGFKLTNFGLFRPPHMHRKSPKDLICFYTPNLYISHYLLHHTPVRLTRSCLARL